MSENQTPAVETAAPAPAPAPQLVKLGAHEFPFVLKMVEVTKRTKGKDGKTTSVKEQHPVITPVVNDLAAVLSYTSIVFNTVDERSPGAAVKLFNELFGDRIRTASDEAWNQETGNDDVDKLVAGHLQVERPRSAGMKLDEINARLAALAPEYMSLIDASRDNSWASLVSPETGAQLFDSTEAFALRLSAVVNEMTKLVAVRQEKEKKSLEIKAKREAKAAKLQAAVKEAAANAPAVPTN